MRDVGLDLHKRSLGACAIDAKGKRLFRQTVNRQREALEQFAREQLRPTGRAALEATTKTRAVVTILRPRVAGVVVGNPLEIKAIAQAKVKTDKIGAEAPAQLLRCDYRPAARQPDGATQELRQLTNVRAGLVADGTRLKNRVPGLLAPAAA